MRDNFIKYRYLGYSSNEIEKYNNELDKSNLRLLRDICIVFFLMSIVVSIFYYYFDYNSQKILICLFYGTMAGIIFRISKYMYDNINIINTLWINLLISFTTFTCYTYGIYLGTFVSSGGYSVTIIWMFMLMQIIFNVIPVYNLISVVPSVIIFIICSAMTKDTIYVAYDILHAALVIIIGGYVSYKKSKLKLDYLVTSYQLKMRNDELFEDNKIDYLTRLHNRKYIFEKLYEIQDQCLLNDQKISCLIIDVDNFKAYNDYYGHPSGDTLLSKIGQAFKELEEQYKINIGRIGGEEFLAVWNGDSLEHSKIIAEILKDTVIKLNLQHEKSDVIDIVTISQGLYTGSCEKCRTEIDYVYNMADKGLYEAKRSGKNCINSAV